MQVPLFSFLIANYNNGIFLEEAIQSVFAQTYTNWEIILVDDDSTDNSKEIYLKYSSDPRIHIYYNDKNYGCGYTKHRCVELANGDICGFLDSDDVLASTALNDTITLQTKERKASLVYTDSYYCDNNLQILNIKTTQTSIPDNLTYLEYGNFAIFHFATFKKTKYLETKGINPELLRAVDQDLYLKLEEVGNLYYYPNKLYYYRTGTNNNISLGYNSRKATMWHLVVLIDACRRRNIDIEKNIYQYYDMFINMYSKEHTRLVETQLYDTYNSFSFKLGKVLTAPFRWLKKKKKITRSK